jgi:hypothetical protein
VVYRRDGDLRPDLVAEILEHATIKILGIVDCDLLWNFVVTDDILPEEFWTVEEVMLVMGFASTHLVKYSTATIAKV